MKTATYEEFCQHYGLNKQDVDAKADYKKYLAHLSFTQSLFKQDEH
ncbi:MAG: hypothetical protein HRT38_15785 [Alteromonadaceae bacterium]|nr:hypothetical protein [Alteromonadaceae bacterium]